MTFHPVVPFEPIRADKIPVGKHWTAQVKWDGVRILTYYDGQSVRLFNRRLNERTMQYPEFGDVRGYCSASSVILDGEVIALKNGRPSFRRVMKRDGVRQPDKVASVQRQVPVFYMIFDILFYNGTWVTELPLQQRQAMLRDVVREAEVVQLVENIQDAQALFDITGSQSLEGIVCKDLFSKYAVNGKDARWQKLKNYQDLIAVVGGVTYRGNIVNALLLGLYDKEGQLWYIGHAGTGKLTSAEWRQVTESIAPLVIKKRPFLNKPERVKDAVWIEPILTVKVRFLEWTEGNTLRQPSIQAFVSVQPNQCVFE